MIVPFFLYDILYTSFSSFKTEYIYEKQYNTANSVGKGYKTDHLQKSWSDPKGPRGPGFKGSSEIHHNYRMLKF